MERGIDDESVTIGVNVANKLDVALAVGNEDRKELRRFMHHNHMTRIAVMSQAMRVSHLPGKPRHR
jgi:hypothetical protein